MTRTTLALLAVVAIASPILASPAAAQELVLTEQRAPYADARDLVFVAEGYRQGEKDDFARAVRAFVDALEGDGASPVRATRDRWNMHAVFVPSRERAQPRRDGPRDSAMRMHVRSDGLLACDAAAADAAAATAPDVDVVIVVGRFSFSFGTPRASADYPPFGARVRIAERDVATLVHELGHAVYALGDEYTELDAEIPAAERPWMVYFANLTCDPSGARFAGVASPPLVEGGGHYTRGVYRAERHCRMRASGSDAVGFCAVCRHQIDGAAAAAPAAPRADAAGSTLRLAADATSTRYDVTVRASNGAQVLRLPVEGGARALDLTALVGPGVWDVEVRAANLAGLSAPTRVRVGGGLGPIVLAPGTPIPAASRGLVSALRR